MSTRCSGHSSAAQGLEGDTAVMANYWFTTQGIHVGYGRNGFFASGKTTVTELSYRPLRGGEHIPNIDGHPVNWEIDAKGESQWDHYLHHVAPRQRDAGLTERPLWIPEIFEATGQPVGLMWMRGDALFLRYSLPPDPAFATFIMGVIASGRELGAMGTGFYFKPEGAGGPAPTVSGFVERGEPLFLASPPNLGLQTAGDLPRP